MCSPPRRIRFVAIVGAATLAATPVSVRAQTVRSPETEAQLLERIESLRPVVEDARIALEVATVRRQREARAAAEGRAADTLRLGSMTVLTPPEDAGLARTLFTEVWDERFAPLGVPSPEGWTFVFRRGDHAAPFVAEETDKVREVRLQDWEVPLHGREVVRVALARAVMIESQALATPNGGLVGDPFAHPDPELHYRVLATRGSKATGACLIGELQACKHALGLDMPQDIDPMDVWYTPEQRRALVMQASWPATPNFPSEAYARCTDGSDLAACDALFDSRTARWMPLSAATRASILWMALQRGGSDAWARLVEHGSEPTEQLLEEVSGTDLDRLVAEWRRWVLDNRPVAHAGLVGRSALTLLWIGLFVTLAARSTRWRLG